MVADFGANWRWYVLMWLLMLVLTGGSMSNVVADVGANWR